MATASLFSTIFNSAACSNKKDTTYAVSSIKTLGLKSKLFNNAIKLFSVPSLSSQPVRHSKISASFSGKTGNLKTYEGDSNYLPFLKPSQIPQSEDTTSLEEKLEILRDRRGYWHEYAPLISALNRSGITAPVIEEATGMTGIEQNAAVVAAQVYSTISLSGGLSDEELAFYNSGGADILYELRILSTTQRQDSARYVAEKNLDSKMARELAKAIKQHERRGRDEGRNFFSTAPGDCLAFSLYRVGKECKIQNEKESVLKQALDLVVTEKARSKINQALGIESVEEIKEAKPTVTARILSGRPSMEEVSSKPIQVLGYLSDIDQASISSAEPSPNLEGPYQIFSPPSHSKWVFLPSWNAIKLAKKLVAILVKDISDLPEGLFSKSTDPPVLLVEIAESVNDSSFYLVSGAFSKGMVLKPGQEIAESDIVYGKVLMAVFPPILEEEEKDWA